MQSIAKNMNNIIFIIEDLLHRWYTADTVGLYINDSV